MSILENELTFNISEFTDPLGPEKHWGDREALQGKQRPGTDCCLTKAAPCLRLALPVKFLEDRDHLWLT